MKIEKINKNKFRCILSSEDLASRKININELAYGSPKARQLFTEIVTIASRRFGFDADGTPLMIEAVPVPNNCLILVVSKVEDSDELDTRFSTFTSDDQDGNIYDDSIDNQYDNSLQYSGTVFPQIPEGSNVSDNVISGNMPDVMKQLKNFMNSVSDGKGTENADSRNKPPVLDENVRMLGNFAVMSVNESKPSTEANGKKSQERNEKKSNVPVRSKKKDSSGLNGKNEGNVKDNAGVIDTAKIKNKVKDISKADDGNKSITELIYIQAFSFKGIDTAIKLSHILPFFHGIESTLFKDEKKNEYYLTYKSSGCTPKEFSIICNITSEYMQPEIMNIALVSYMEEHYRTVFFKNAINQLKKI
jgi:adapter protein MecA 1/2